MKGQANNEDTIVGVSYGLSQGYSIDKFFFEELRYTSMSTALVIVEDFILSEINWEYYTAGTTQAQKFLKTWMTTLWNGC